MSCPHCLLWLALLSCGMWSRPFLKGLEAAKGPLPVDDESVFLRCRSCPEKRESKPSPCVRPDGGVDTKRDLN